MKKKLTMLAMFAAAIVAWAETETVGDYTWTYRISGDTAEIYGAYSSYKYTPAISPSPTGAVTIPSTLGGKPVTSIGEYAFCNCSGLASVTIPDGVTTIGDNAFSGCSEMTSITIPNGVTTIGDTAFWHCGGLKSVTIPSSVTSIGYDAFSGCNDSLYDDTTISSVMLIDGWAIGYDALLSGALDLTAVRGIGDLAFHECAGITSVTIGKNIKVIGFGAFETCSGLTSVTIRDGVTGIESYAFRDCTNLTSVTIPNSVTSVGRIAFDGCKDSLYDGATIPGMKLVDGWAVGNDGTLSGALDLTGIKGIAGGALSECSGITSVRMPNRMTSIEERTFYACHKLTSVTMPEKLKYIGDSAFEFCGLTSVTIPNSVTRIGDSAFANCDFASVTLPDGLAYIGRAAFQCCENLTSIVIPRGVTSIERYAFSSCGLKNVTMPDSVTRIEDDAFSGCKFTSVVIPCSVASIGNYVFRDCRNLVDVIFEGNAPNMGTDVFGHDRNDSVPYTCCAHVHKNSIGWEVPIPGSWNGINIDYSTMVGGGEIKTATVNGLTWSYTVSGGEATIFGGRYLEWDDEEEDYTWEYITAIPSGTSGTVTVPSSLGGCPVTAIGDGAFTECERITSVVIPSGVVSIGEDAFSDCTSLRSVSLPEGLETIGKEAFESCALADISLPESLKTIGDKAFGDCAEIASVRIPVSVKSIGVCAFQRCGALKKAWAHYSLRGVLYSNTVFSNSPTTVKYYYGGTEGDANAEVHASVVDGIEWSYTVSGGEATIFGGAYLEWDDEEEDYTWEYVAAIPSDTSGTVTVPSSLGGYPVTAIGNGAFTECERITSVIIPSGVVSIGEDAFSDCTALVSVSLPEGLVTIGKDAFDGCGRLSVVALPSTLTTIGSRAFDGCSSLDSMDIPGKVKTIGYHAFARCTGLRAVTVSELLRSQITSNAVFDKCSPAISYTDAGMVTLTFDPNGGTVTEKSRKVPQSEDEWIENFPVPTRTGYKFAGWFTSKGYDAQWEESVRADTNTTLYALWWKSAVVNGVAWGYAELDGNAAMVIGELCRHTDDGVWYDHAAAIAANTSGAVTIPSHVNGRTVTKIGESAFWECDRLTGIDIPSSVKAIDSYAFAHCTALKRVTMPGELDCDMMGTFLECESLEDIVIPQGVRNIEYPAFCDCSGLKSIVLPLGLESISANAFTGCSLLTSVTVPYGVETIEDWAFNGCAGLKAISLPPYFRDLTVYLGCPNDCVITYRDAGGYEITLDANGGSGGGKIYRDYGQRLGEMMTPSRNQCAFSGWFTARAGGDAVTEASFVTGNATYYAHWTVNQYMVAFDSNGGIGGSRGKQDYGSAIVAPTVTRTGYTFTGWQPLPLETVPSNDVAYTAQWIANSYTVKFNANGAEGTMADQPMTYDVPAGFSAIGFSKDDSYFRGWAKSADGAVVYPDCAIVTNLTSVADGVVTLYAVWLRKSTSALACEDMFAGTGTVWMNDDGSSVVTLTNDVSGTVEIPDNVGAVTIDLNGHDIVGDGGPAMQIVKGDGEGDATQLAIVDTSDGEKGRIAGGGESAGIEVAEDAATGVKLDVEEGVGVFNGDGTEQELKPKLEGAGKVVVPKSWKVGQKVTWKAKADKGSVFARWEGPLVDSLNLTRNERRNPSLAFAVPDGFATNQITAVFLPIDDDGLYTLGITQTEFGLKEAVYDVCVTDDSQSYVTASASGLPAGLKFDAKKMCITGAPTKGGVYWVQIKAKNASGYQWAENVKVTVSGDGKEAKEPKLTRTAYHPLTVICATEGGTVSGTGVYAEGKKVTIKATAAKGYVFAGWYETANNEKGIVNSVDGADYRSTSLNVTVPETRYVFARFATKEDDADSLKVAVEDVTTEADGTIGTDGTRALDLGACVSSLSLPKLAVSGLPTGLKYDAKTLKISGKTTKPGVYTVTVKATNASVTKATEASTATFKITVPNFACDALPGLLPATDAYGTIYAGVKLDAGLIDCSPDDGWTVKAAGLPTGLKFATKETKDAMYGIVPAWTVYGVPTAKAGSYTATFTASKKGEANQVATITLNVKALPDWAVGTFYGKNVARGLDGTWTCPMQFTVTISANGKISMKTTSPGGGAESRTAQLTECREDGSFSFSFHYVSGRKGKDGYTEGDCAGVISPVAYGEDGTSLGRLTTHDVGVCDEDDDPFESEGVGYRSLYSRKPAVAGLPVFGKDNIRVVPVNSDCSDGEVTLKFGTKGAVTATWSGTKPVATCSSYISPYARDADGTVHAKLWLTFLDKTRIDGYGDFVQTGFEFDLLIPAADKVSASEVEVVSARLTSIMADIFNGGDMELEQQ